MKEQEKNHNYLVGKKLSTKFEHFHEVQQIVAPQDVIQHGKSFSSKKILREI